MQAQSRMQDLVVTALELPRDIAGDYLLPSEIAGVPTVWPESVKLELEYRLILAGDLGELQQLVAWLENLLAS